MPRVVKSTIRNEHRQLADGSAARRLEELASASTCARYTLTMSTGQDQRDLGVPR